jgi:hypothetical protein
LGAEEAGGVPAELGGVEAPEDTVDPPEDGVGVELGVLLVVVDDELVVGVDDGEAGGGELE